jgi:hypothetical protein
VLALDYSGARSRRHPIMAATTTATITPRMPVHRHLRFGIGAMHIRAITLRSPNVRFLGVKFNNAQKILARLAGSVKPLSSLQTLTRWAPAIEDKVL